MKRIIIFAAVAIAAIACSKTYQVDPSASEGTAIGFNTWAEQLTKTRDQGSSAFAAGDDFAVYGYKEKGTEKVTVFDDDVVSTTDGTTWTYTPLRFWDTNYDAYTFFAVSPAAIGTAGTVDPQNGEITSATITFGGDDNDILVADKKTVNKTDAPEPFASFATVPLVFNHAASLVDLKVKKTPNLKDAVVTVSAFKLANIFTEGALSVNDAYTSTHPVISWSDATPGEYLPADGVTPVDISSPIVIAEDTAFDPASPATPAAATDLITSLVAKPQTFATTGDARQAVELTYQIAMGDDIIEHTGTLYLSDFDIVDNASQDDTKVAAWEPGKHYTFYITLDANVITFSATITDWVTADGYHYLVK